MTNERINEVLSRYETALQLVVEPFAVLRLLGLAAEGADGTYLKFKHLLDMIPKVRGFVAEGRLDKANRWLGFVQGVLWATGYYTIDEMRKHNAPESGSAT